MQTDDPNVTERICLPECDGPSVTNTTFVGDPPTPIQPRHALAATSPRGCLALRRDLAAHLPTMINSKQERGNCLPSPRSKATVGVNSCYETGSAIRTCPLSSPPVLRKDRQARVGTIQNVIHPTTRRCSLWSSHETNLRLLAAIVNEMVPDTFVFFPSTDGVSRADGGSHLAKAISLFCIGAAMPRAVRLVKHW